MNNYSEPCYPISKTELFDEENLSILQRNAELPKNVKFQLSSYSKHRLTGGKISTIYKLADNCVEHQIGRIYPIDQLSMSGMRFDVRNPLGAKNYFDIDMENAHYRIALKYCKDNGLPHENIEKYVNNRDAMLKAVSSSRKKAKTEFLKILYGGDIKLYKSEYNEAEGDVTVEGYNILKSLQSEVVILMEIIWSKNSHLYNLKVGSEKKPLNKLPLHKAKATMMSLIFQTEERKILMFIDAFMKTKGRSMDVFIHDGGYIRKQEGETSFPTELLVECSKSIQEVLNYDIPLAQKPIVYEATEFVTKNDYYANKKIEIEQRYAQVGGDFIEIMEDEEPRMISCKDLKIFFKMYNYQELNFETNKMVKKYFFDTWTDDATHRTYSRMDFIPDRHNCPADVYNLFTGFKAEKLIGSYEYNEDILEPIFRHLEILSENNLEWILQWFAWKIQRPHQKVKVLPLFRDVEKFLEKCGGTGKTTFIEWFGSEILGDKYFLSIHNNEDLYNSFNGQFEGKLLINLEEAEGSSHHKHDNVLKARTTATKINVNKKNINAYKVNDYADIIANTNTKNPFKINLSNRRIIPFDVATTYRDDKQYFDKLFACLNNKQAIYSFFIYLRDVVVVPDKLELPKTKALVEMTLMNIPVQYKWICNLIKSNKMSDMFMNEAYDNFIDFCKTTREGKGSLSMTAFGLLLNDTPYIEKRRNKQGMKLYFKVDNIIPKLKEMNILENDFVYGESVSHECLIDDDDDDAKSQASTNSDVYIDGILQAE